MGVSRSLAFPFGVRGDTFPGSSSGSERRADRIAAALTQRRGERRMRPRIGVNVHEWVFESLTPIGVAQLNGVIRSSLELTVPDIPIMSVQAMKAESGGRLGFRVRIVYVDDGELVEMEV